MLNLLAQAAVGRSGRMQSLQDRFAEPVQGVGWRILLFFVLLLTAIFLVWMLGYIQRRRFQEARAQPMALFMRVQRQLGLPLWSRWRLRQLARAIGIDQPAALLISTGLFDQAVEQYCAGRGMFGSRLDAGPEFVRIREQIFGRLPEVGSVALAPPADYNAT